MSLMIHFGEGETYEVPTRVGEAYAELQEARHKYEQHIRTLERKLEAVELAAEPNSALEALARETLEWSRAQGRGAR